MASRGRKLTGEVREHVATSGIITYSIRVRWQGDRINIRLGTELDGWNRPLAELKLQETMQAIAAGVWRPPVPDIPAEDRDPIFHEFATVWLDRQTVDLDHSTAASYGHVLSRYILPEFKGHRLTEITYEAVLRWRDRLRREAEQLKLAKQNGIHCSTDTASRKDHSEDRRSMRHSDSSDKSSTARWRASTTFSTATRPRVGRVCGYELPANRRASISKPMRCSA